MSNIIAFPVRFSPSDRDRIIVSRWLRTGEDGGQVGHAVHHVDSRGKPIGREAASAERSALIEIDIRQVRS